MSRDDTPLDCNLVSTGRNHTATNHVANMKINIIHFFAFAVGTRNTHCEATSGGARADRQGNAIPFRIENPR